MADLREICDRIRYLGTQPETPEARAEVEAAFSMKWEGVQVVAARALGHWGGRRSVELIRNWLLNYYENGRGYSVEQAATEALLECFENQDVPWMLDVYFDEPRKLWAHRLIFSMPPHLAQARILAELQNSSAKHRHNALIAAHVLHIVEACPFLEQLRENPYEPTRVLVRAVLPSLCP